MSILINKLTALTLTSTIGDVNLGTVPYASSSHNLQNQISVTQKVNNQGLYSIFNEQAFIKLMQPYIKVKNNKYIIDANIYENIQINESDINLLKEMLSKANEQIRENNLKKVSVTNGAIKQGYNDNGIYLTGVNGIHFYWWGVYLYLNGATTTFVATAGASVATNVLVSITGGALALAAILIITGAIAYFQSYSPKVQDGCVISYNYAFGIQDIWAQ